MTHEEVQQILGLLVNAGLAMSTLVIFFVARHLIQKKRVAPVKISKEENGKKG